MMIGFGTPRFERRLDLRRCLRGHEFVCRPPAQFRALVRHNERTFSLNRLSCVIIKFTGPRCRTLNKASIETLTCQLQLWSACTPAEYTSS